MTEYFLQFLSPQIKGHTLETPSKSRKYHRNNKMSDAAIVATLTLFHMMDYLSKKLFEKLFFGGIELIKNKKKLKFVKLTLI